MTEDEGKLRISRYSDLAYTPEEQKIVESWWTEYDKHQESCKFPKALQVVKEEFRKDQSESSVYSTWKQTLSRLFAEAAITSDPMPPCQERYDWLHKAGDKAAEEFLRLLIK